MALSPPVLHCATVQAQLASARVDEDSDPGDVRLLGIAAHSIRAPVDSHALLSLADVGLRREGRFGLLPAVTALRMQDMVVLGEWEAADAAADSLAPTIAGAGPPRVGAAVLAGQATLAALRGDDARAQLLVARLEQAVAAHHLGE